ncbi:MAG TPA: CoA pyrophosphatase, partial [Prolixibacteraceae bacterium]|nr:CoA pyrophosphatase [Prolixibacteraceae bacterium]
GKIEKKDAGPREAAIRETREEIGVLPEQVEILGSLSELYISVTGFLIHPFVGWTPAKPTFQLNHGEVEKLLLFPLLSYLRHQSVETVELDTVTGKLQVPAILFEGEIIWGATAMILSEFADLLSPALAPE